MKKLFKLTMVAIIGLSLFGCSSAPASNQLDNDSKQKEEEKEESREISADDVPEMKALGDDIATHINNKMNINFTYNKIKSNKDWGHIIYIDENTPVTLEIDFMLSSNKFIGVTVDNNSIDVLNSNYRAIPVALLTYPKLDITEEEHTNIINLLVDMETHEIENERIKVLDDKMLNIFGISLK